MGVSPFVGPFDVYASKIETIEDDTDDQRGMSDQPLMRLGQLLEDGVAMAYGEKYGATITKPTHLLAHDDVDWWLANPDRFAHRDVDGDGIVEVKQGHSSSKYEDGLPDYIELQAHHYLGVVEWAAWCDVAVLMFGRDLVRYRVERDDELLAGLRSIEEEFWVDRVLARRPPEPDALAGDTLKRLYPKPTAGKVVELDDEFREHVRLYREAQQAEKAAKAEVARIGNVLRAAVGDAETALLDGVPAFDWKGSATRVDLDAIEEDNPGFLDLYRKTKPERKLTIRKAFQ